MSSSVGKQIASLADLEINIISQLLDFTGGSPYDLAQLEAALSCCARTEVTSDSFQRAHCERWARLIAVETELCLRIPTDALVQESIKDGVLVRISGLKAKPELNGQLLLVQTRDADSGRWKGTVLQDGRLISCKRENLIAVQGMLPTSVLKTAVSIRSISAGLHGGWRGLTSAHFLRGLQLLEQINQDKRHGRTTTVETPLGRGGETEVPIQLDRMMLAHFDVVFDENVIPVVESFKQDNLSAIGVAHSRSIEVEIGGEKAEIVFKFESRPDPGQAHDEIQVPEPHVGLNVHVDLEQFKLKAKGGRDDILILSCALLSKAHEHRHFSHTLHKFDSTGFVQELWPWHGLYRPCVSEPLFQLDPTANSQHHISTLLLYAGSACEEKAPIWAESTWRASKRGLMEGSPVMRSAVWNRGSSGTEIVPIIHPEHNEQALEPFPKDAFDGAIALVRRGGGNGFAQKAAAAKRAGAVGCIIFDGSGPLDEWFFEPGCSLVFNDVVHPDPGIPTVLVDKEVGMKLSVASRASGGACARILVDSSRETLTKLPPAFEEFLNNVVSGEPVHLAMLVERKRRKK